jgi:NADH:ubiquinone oxidoreductase subunit F (NADH-binding)
MTTFPDTVTQPGLLAGRRLTLPGHLAYHGPVPWQRYSGNPGRAALLDAVEAAGLTGRGGAGFPTARKMRVAAGGAKRAIVVANGCEGERMSQKDRTLMRLAPHLVLDGVMLAAHAVRATEAIICVHRGDPSVAALAQALGERGGDPVATRIVEVPARYVASEESALVNFLANGDARPTAKPPRPVERGLNGRPTLVDNVETLAQLARLARIGPELFRAGESMLVTVSGAVSGPGVYEVPAGSSVGAVLELAGGAGAAQAVLVGGYGGSWLALPAGNRVPMTHRALSAAGASLGVAALWVLPASADGLTETAGILAYLAGESANQCGPCMFGLPAIAADFADLAARRPGPALSRLRRRLGVIPGRGACGHPDGAVRLAASALRVFAGA